MMELSSMADSPSALLTLSAPYYRWEGKLYVEDQSISGMKAWSEHFPKIVMPSVCLHEPPPPAWSVAAAHGIVSPQIELVELPNGYDRATFLRRRKEVAEQLLGIMRRCNYNLFAIGGWIGDWGVTGALTA
ncbi:MAG: hypothetical protein AAFW98_10980, partial [Pseudomonadota bacterium]